MVIFKLYFIYGHLYGTVNRKHREWSHPIFSFALHNRVWILSYR